MIDLACDVSLPINERHDRLANLATLVGLDEESKVIFRIIFSHFLKIISEELPSRIRPSSGFLRFHAP